MSLIKVLGTPISENGQVLKFCQNLPNFWHSRPILQNRQIFQNFGKKCWFSKTPYLKEELFEEIHQLKNLYQNMIWPNSWCF